MGGGADLCVVENFGRCSSIHATMHRMHPFDMIAFDGDGYSIPDVDVDVQAEVRAQWRRLNAVEVPSIR